MRFHLASEWTISTVSSLGRSFASKATGRSTPFKLSFNPVSFSTKSGADILCKCNFCPKTSWNRSRMKTIAASVSRIVRVGWYFSGKIKDMVFTSKKY